MVHRLSVDIGMFSNRRSHIHPLYPYSPFGAIALRSKLRGIDPQGLKEKKELTVV